MNNKNKFRVLDIHSKSYQNIDLGKSVQQFVGIFDKHMKEIYEGDVVVFEHYFGLKTGLVKYSNNQCSFVIDSDVDFGLVPFTHIPLDSLEIIGNINEDYIYDEKGELVKKTNS